LAVRRKRRPLLQAESSPPVISGTCLQRRVEIQLNRPIVFLTHVRQHASPSLLGQLYPADLLS
jgi:hypothetical protein